MSEGAATPHADINVFVSSISANTEIRRKQLSLLQVLDTKRISFVKRDIAVNAEDKREFRELMQNLNNASATPPQIFRETHYCGDYDAFYHAVDEDRLYEFLGLERPGKNSSQPDQAAVDQVAASGETYNEEIQTTIAVETKLQQTTS